MKTLLFACLLLSVSCCRSLAEPQIKYFDPGQFAMDQITLPTVHVWAGEPFQLELKEIPRREIPYGITTWFKEVEWLPDNWTPLGDSGKLDVLEDCQNSIYPQLRLVGCGANLLAFAVAHVHPHTTRFLGRYFSQHSHLYFYVPVVVHQHKTVLVPTWYGTHFQPTWKDLHYPQILRFQCVGVGAHTGLPVFSEVKNFHQGKVEGWGSNRTSLIGNGVALFGFSNRDTGVSSAFEARCCVKGETVGLDNKKCSSWVRIELRSTIYARRNWCPKFQGNYELTKDRLAHSDISVSSKCRHSIFQIQGRMKSHVCENQTVVYRPHYPAEAWFKQSLYSPVLNNMLPFEGDSGSQVAPNNLTIFHMSHSYSGWYLYNTSKVAAREVLAELSMEPQLRVFVQLVKLTHLSLTVKCVTNLDHARQTDVKVWWEIKSSVQSISKPDSRTLVIEDACRNTRHLMNYLFHLRCHASTSLQTGVSEWFSGKGWRTYWEHDDMPPWHWGRWLFG